MAKTTSPRIFPPVRYQPCNDQKIVLSFYSGDKVEKNGVLIQIDDRLLQSKPDKVEAALTLPVLFESGFST